MGSDHNKSNILTGMIKKKPDGSKPHLSVRRSIRDFKAVFDMLKTELRNL